MVLPLKTERLLFGIYILLYVPVNVYMHLYISICFTLSV